MGNASSFREIGWEEMQSLLDAAVILHALRKEDEYVLIKNTLPAEKEEETVNAILKEHRSTTIVVYGENYLDKRPEKKVDKIKNLTGAEAITFLVYRGGLYEWMIHSILYTQEEFQTIDMRESVPEAKRDPLTFAPLVPRATRS
eukprot:scaffold1618_cov158-Pinguiococcus_pyrenoidosus.AAC.1